MPASIRVFTNPYKQTCKQPADCIQTLRGHQGPIFGVAISSDSKLIATACGNDNSIKLWDVSSGKIVHTLIRERFFSLDFSSDGSVLVSASSLSSKPGPFSSVPLIRIWGLNPGEVPTVLHTLKGHTNRILCVKVSPDCEKLVSTSYDETVRVWSVQTGALLATCCTQSHMMKTATWTLDSKRIATAGDKPGIRVFEAATGRQLMEFKEPGRDLPPFRTVCLAFVNDVRVLVCASVGPDVVVYELSEEQDVESFKTLLAEHERNVTGLVLSPDSKYIASTSWDNIMRVHDVKTGDALHHFEGHSMGADTLAWSLNGDYIASASMDWTACVWTVKEQVCLCVCLCTIYTHSDTYCMFVSYRCAIVWLVYVCVFMYVQRTYTHTEKPTVCMWC
jgi:WD40 repeat protein